jgi:hypothetical protein
MNVTIGSGKTVHKAFTSGKPVCNMWAKGVRESGAEATCKRCEKVAARIAAEVETTEAAEVETTEATEVETTEATEVETTEVEVAFMVTIQDGAEQVTYHFPNREAGWAYLDAVAGHHTIQVLMWSHSLDKAPGKPVEPLADWFRHITPVGASKAAQAPTGGREGLRVNVETGAVRRSRYFI